MSTATSNQLSVNSKQWPTAVRDFFVHAIGQVRILKKAYPGIMHLLIFWGVTIQVVGTAINLMQMALFTPFALENFPRENLYFAYEFIMDLAGLFILGGGLMAAFRRLVLRPKSLPTQWDDYYALIMLTLLPIAGFFTESMRLITAAPEWARYSFVGNALARWLTSTGLTPETAFSLHPILVLIHIFLALTFAACIPFTKLRHLVNAPLNIILHPRRAYGALTKVEDLETAEVLGVGKITEFIPQNLLEFDACLRCGRCEDVCPATQSGMAYSPKTLLMQLRDAMIDTLGTPSGNGNGSTKELPAHLFENEALWSCTTCGACLIVCPAFIRPPERVIDIRRHAILMTGEMPKPIGDTLRNMERQGNPWGMPPQDRMAWAEGLDVRELAPGDEVDVLYFVGCAASFDDRNKKATHAFVKLMSKAGIDFGVLGHDESCCGETARRMGHEYIFQVFAEQNIEAFEQIKFKRIVTQCAHGYNTLKNEYPQMGGDYIVQHSTELLAEISSKLDLGSANGSGIAGKITYHDPCYLGRHNDIYDSPRALLDQAQTHRVEMKSSADNSFCCGGGGGMMWQETEADKRINNRRLQDALDVEAEVVATACPYCTIMLEDAISSKGMGEQIQVMDIAEILEKQIGE
ncbi:MAG: 4Fe-4S dicluster domain-containing protein [Anaerolineales bacterium]|nr:4Fe-4S dicluster domain-containing protein [Chloroflexota bacterium]MBL7161341.1 4Fe-4S dicluster domain-containing protein [Anaerolineales bacterium]